jgi:hypothetical protein
MKKQIIAMSGFYRNGGPDGFGFVIQDRDMENQHRLVLEVADALKDAEPAAILWRLGSYAARGGELGHEDKMQALGYVIAAERKGLLQSDDYNGFLVQYIGGRTLVSDMASHLNEEYVYIELPLEGNKH